MSQVSSENAPVIPVKPQPNVYTVLLIIAIVALCVAIGAVAWKLTTPVLSGGYGLNFSDLFKGGSLPPVR